MGKIKLLISDFEEFTEFPDSTGLSFAIGAIVNGNRLIREVEGEREYYSVQELAKAEYFKNLVNDVINKYSAEKLEEQMRNPEFCLIYSCFYDFYLKDRKKRLLPPTLKTWKLKVALKKAISAIYRKISKNVS